MNTFVDKVQAIIELQKTVTAQTELIVGQQNHLDALVECINQQNIVIAKQADRTTHLEERIRRLEGKATIL
jgi:uncharacterized coiled-coil protein SlyX